MGGESENSGSLIEFSSVEKYDANLNSWSKRTHMPTERGALYGDVVNGKIYSIGGGFHEGSTLYVISKLEEYDPKLDLLSVGAREDNFTLPVENSLFQNYPTPFNSITTIKYSLLNSLFVTLKVYDILGKEIAILINEIKSAGNYSVNFNASNLSSGVYFYRMQAGNFAFTKKFVLLK